MPFTIVDPNPASKKAYRSENRSSDATAHKDDDENRFPQFSFNRCLNCTPIDARLTFCIPLGEMGAPRFSHLRCKDLSA